MTNHLALIPTGLALALLLAAAGGEVIKERFVEIDGVRYSVDGISENMLSGIVDWVIYDRANNDRIVFHSQATVEVREDRDTIVYVLTAVEDPGIVIEEGDVPF